MKLAKLVSVLRPATTMLVLLPLLLIGWADQLAASPVDRALSPPLRNPDTYQAVREVSQHAQGLLTDDDTSNRLNPGMSTHLNEDHLKICCLHANILDFYLNSILPKYSHHRMHRLRTDLTRVSEDLQTHGCNVTHYHNHHHAVEFSRKLSEMPEDQGIKKAVSEIDILYTYLQDFCTHPTNATDAAAAQ